MVRRIPRIVTAGLCAAATLAAPDAATEPRFAAGEWLVYVAPRAARVTVFVASRPPREGEEFPPVGKPSERRCAAAWQIKKPERSAVTARGGWAPSPSGDGRWAFFPSKPPKGKSKVEGFPDRDVDYGNEIFFCAKERGEAPWLKSPTGKTLPGSWVTLADGKKATLLFVANTSAADGDIVPDIPEKVRRVRCDAASHPKGPPRDRNAAARPSVGRWVPDPFGSKRWAWLPYDTSPLSMRPPASPADEPRLAKKSCSWFADE